MISFTPTLLAAYIAAATLLTLTPGVDTAMVLRACAAGGRQPGAYAASGICLGLLVWGAGVALGLGALLQASHLAYGIVKYAGAGYLIWVGVKLIRHPRQGLEETANAPSKTALQRGFLTNLFNPKIGVFYITFLPQFIPPDANVAADSFVLALIHIGITLVWLGLLIAVTAPIAKALRRPALIMALDRTAGAFFILFGLKLAFSKA